jgi:hypothetical protein
MRLPEGFLSFKKRRLTNADEAESRTEPTALAVKLQNCFNN